MPPSPLDTQNSTAAPRKKETGPTIGIIIVLVLLIVGAFYFWGARLNKDTAASNQLYIPAGTTTLPTINQ